MLEFKVFVGMVTLFRNEPFLDMLFVAELRDALELDLLRFSLELVPWLIPLLFWAGAVGVV